nr:intradiol ring-cleavage dioxygenase [uncultured Flavobacterium sp.]
MERKQFFRTMGLAGLALTGVKVLNACSSDDGSITAATDSSTGSGSSSSGGGSSSSGSCTVSPTETAGPFPTKNPSTLVSNDITSDRTGVALDITITVKNVNNSCNVLADAIVDIWHCDKDGNYSEYGGTQMQSTNYTSVHFLRGRQTTDSNGQVAFTSIFPGWYSGRATHIHVHIYNSAGTSLLITQIAFPEGTNSAVVQVNAATAYGYTKGMSGYTYNASDNVFSDDTTGSEIATLTGSVSNGFELTHTINVSA